MRKLFNALLPAILLTLAVGSIYAFSLFSSPISEYIGASLRQVQFAFSLGIFFLGMGAAFFGRIVEKNIRIATILGTALFIGGLCLTQAAILCKSLWMLYLGYGFVVGSATGIIYISPVKTMMLWFKSKPAIASAVSIISFGFGSSLCSFLNGYLHLPVTQIFFALAGIYAIMMIPSMFLLRKPEVDEAIEKTTTDRIKYSTLLKDRYFWQSWLFMFLNISAGLMLIGLCANILDEIHISMSIITLILIICGASNSLGRFVFPAIADYMKSKLTLLWIISLLEIFMIVLGLINVWFIPIMIIIINATYGSFFAMLPSTLLNHYGRKNISTIHGAVLSSWGFASLLAYLFFMIVDYMFSSKLAMLWIILGEYVIINVILFRMKRLY